MNFGIPPSDELVGEVSFGHIEIKRQTEYLLSFW